jgi:heme exporter protein D
MNALRDYLDMGGYAVWVWSAYGISAASLIGLFAWSLRTWRAREKEFAALKGNRP